MGHAATMNIVSKEALQPFGLLVHVAQGTRELGGAQLSEWVDAHRVVVLRGVVPPSRSELVATAHRLGPLQPWSFGAIHEIVPKENPTNYLYSKRLVPLHWDGAFADRVPRILLFQCLKTPPPGEGGETVFVDTTRVFAQTSEADKLLYGQLRFTYETDHVAHYGGTFTKALLDVHPRTHAPVLRFAEPVIDVNPVRVRAEGLDPLESARQITALRHALSAEGCTLAHAWQEGDILLADNHALLHGRLPFTGENAARHLRRVNILDIQTRTWRDDVRDMIRIRRPEFMVAEIPILFIAALVSGAPARFFVSLRFLELATLFFLLFHFGDMANCLADRELDAVYKTKLSEAVLGLGPRRVVKSLLATALVALALSADLAMNLGRPLLVGFVLLGLILGHQYSFGPVRFKSRGILQIAALIVLIFVGPACLVAEVCGGYRAALGFFVAYGAMQQGIILLNTAEDLPEDREAQIYTSAVSLGLRGTVFVALLLITFGGLVVGAALALPLLHTQRLFALLPFALALGWVLSGVASLFARLHNADPEMALAHLRAAARLMPVWLTATAWSAMLAALAVRV
jgi:alpha-ketoglutarate-dependent taurine dioxygenase/4-hydroxybenzoate polyprenyltransferase